MQGVGYRGKALEHASSPLGKTPALDRAGPFHQVDRLLGVSID